MDFACSAWFSGLMNSPDGLNMNPDEVSSDFPKKGRRKASLREDSSVPSRMVKYENTFYALFSWRGRDPGPGFFIPQDQLDQLDQR